MIDRVINVFNDGIEKQIFRNFEPNHFFISMLGMSMIIFIVRPFIHLFGLEIGDEEDFMRKHKINIQDLLFHGILKNELGEKGDD